MRRFFSLLILATLLAFPAQASALGGKARIPRNSYPSAYDIWDSFGVCAHLGWTTAESATNVSYMLKFLGIKHLRYDVSTSANEVALNVYKTTGVTFDGLITTAEDYETKRDGILQNIQIYDSVEGMNEVNGKTTVWDDLPVYEAERAAAQQIYDDFKDYVNVYSQTLSKSVADDIYAGIVADYAPWTAEYLSSHIYPVHDGKSSYASMRDKAALDRPLVSNVPVVFTEIGTHTVTSTGDKGSGSFSNCALTELVQAKFSLNSLFSGFLLGNYKTYLYELVDNSSETVWTTSENHYGHFYYNLVAKLSAISIQRVVNILRDTTNSFTVDLDMTTSGIGTNTKQIIAQKSDASHLVIMWQSVRLWNWDDGGYAIITPDDTVTMTFTSSKKLSIYDPIIGGAPQIEIGKTFDIDVPDYPLIIHVENL